MTDDRSGFVTLRSLKQRLPDPDAVLADIRRIYFSTTRRTIQHDLTYAIKLLRSLPTEGDREKATVYMDGLSQMRSTWSKRASASRKDKPISSKIKGSRR